MRVSIYSRVKTHRGWRFRRVKFGRGLKHADVAGPFYLRHTLEGRQVFTPAKSADLADVVQEAQKLAEALTAESRGLTVKEYDEVTNAHRVTIQSACDEFIKLRQKKAPRTVAAYTLHLKEFQESLDRRTRFMDDIDAGTLRKYLAFMTERGHSPTTQDSRLTTVFSLLKKNGIKERLGREELPEVEVEAAVPFSEPELEKLFAAMTDEERVRYKFFLDVGARDSEVAHASWADLDLHGMVFHIRAKLDVGFRLKGKESRDVPLPSSLAKVLKERKKKAPHPRWVFINKEGNPEKHFLRKFKAVAYRAGLNCGHCKSETSLMTKRQRAEIITKVDWENWDKQTKLTRTVTCADAPVCQHFYLHRLRKTCATRWHHAGVPVRTIQAWLGHKSLEVTQRYLGVADLHSPKVRQMVEAAAFD